MKDSGIKGFGNSRAPSRRELYRLYHIGLLSLLDIHFAGFMEGLSGGCIPELSLGAALVSSRTREGHVCLDLRGIAERPLPAPGEGDPVLFCPALGPWCERLRESGVVGSPGHYRPLILDDSFRLYLFRYWDYQERLAQLIRTRASEDEKDLDLTLLRQGLERLFPHARHENLDWQMVAAVTALTKRFCVISGGPGTGKTSTVSRILALLLEAAAPAGLRIALTAPTGKAAARLQETIRRTKPTLDCPEDIKGLIPEEASTIHRLLGAIPGSPYFRHNAKNRLDLDVVVVDEASMTDLALMSKLIQALPQKARVVLLGDKDQLASVEAGAVLGDICDTGNTHGFSRRFSNHLKVFTGRGLPLGPEGEEEPVISDCIVELKESYRFGVASGIGLVSRAINEGDADQALRVLRDSKYGDVTWRGLPRPGALPRVIKDSVIMGYGHYLTESNPDKIFGLFDRFRILCALRKGPYGVYAINSLVEQILKEGGLIEPGKRWYPGRPVLITKNDYNLRLFNGDVGIVMPDPQADDDLRVFFPTKDGTPRKLHPVRLPEHETVFAMTVHKSQGSEFDNVLLLLPDRESPVLTRELLYTGITRARGSVEIMGVEGVLRTGISRRIQRTSGLRDTLWGS